MEQITGNSNYRVKEEFKNVEYDPIPTISETRFIIKEEGLDTEFIKEKPHFLIKDESKDLNINKQISEEGFHIKDEGLDIEFTKEELQFHNEDESKHLNRNKQISEKGFHIKNEGFDVEFTKEEPHFHIEDEYKDWNISKRISEEVWKDSSIENKANIFAPWPLAVCASKVKGASLSVLTEARLPRGVTFGPYEGSILSCVSSGEELGYGCRIQDEASLGRYINTVDLSVSNWLHFITCSQTYKQANMATFENKGHIFCKTVTEINRDAELMVWYGNKPEMVFHSGIQDHKEDSNEHVNGTTISYLKFSLKSIPLKCHNSAKIDANHTPSFPLILNFDKNDSNDNEINLFRNRNNFKIFFTNYLHEKPLEKTLSNRYLEDSKFPNIAQKGLGYSNKSNEFYKFFQCDKAFIQPGNLKMHSQIHIGERPYKCTQCDKAFNRSDNLKIHLRIHSGEKPYKCTECNKAFVCQYRLKRHLPIHSEEKPYKCNECDKTFTQFSILKMHLKIHSGEKPYKCTECNKAFVCRGRLKKHLRIHSGEKPYKCNECDKAFTQFSTLKIHLKIHSGEKPYKCTECDKAFVWPGRLKMHLQIHSGEKFYKCTHCDKSFIQLNHLKTHLKIHSREGSYKCTYK